MTTKFVQVRRTKRIRPDLDLRSPNGRVLPF